jgi:arginine repressor
MRGERIMIGLVLATLCGGQARARQGEDRTRTERTPQGVTEQRERRLTATVTAIDKNARTVTLKGEGGETETVDVPPGLKAFDRIKLGDRVNIGYHESVAVALETGAEAGKPRAARTESSSAAPGKGITRTRQVEMRAEVVSVEPGKHQVTLRGPEGNTQTITVEDPDLRAKLRDLKPGATVAVVYTEAVAASLAPAAGGKQK